MSKVLSGSVEINGSIVIMKRFWWMFFFFPSVSMTAMGDETGTPRMSDDLFAWVEAVSMPDVVDMLVESGLAREDAQRVMRKLALDLRQCWRDAYREWGDPDSEKDYGEPVPDDLAKLKEIYRTNRALKTQLDTCALTAAAEAGLVES